MGIGVRNMFNFPSIEDFSELTEEKAIKINKYAKYILVIFLAFFSAKLITNSLRIFGNQYVNSGTSSVVVQREVNKKTDDNPFSDYEVIITRNIFNSTNEIPDEEVSRATEDSGTENASKSTMPISLVGTIVLNDPSLSVAAIKIDKEDKTNAYTIGDVILSKAQIVTINRHKVFFKNKVSGDLEYIEMLFDESDNTTSTTRDVSDSGIRVIDDEHVIMERGELNKALGNMNQLLMEARAIPYRKNGEMLGFKILGIKPGSLYDRLGVKNGDVVQSINGLNIKSPADAMKLYNQISSSNLFNVDLIRGGVNKSVRLDIR